MICAFEVWLGLVWLIGSVGLVGYLQCFSDPDRLLKEMTPGKERTALACLLVDKYQKDEIEDHKVKLSCHAGTILAPYRASFV